MTSLTDYVNTRLEDTTKAICIVTTKVLHIYDKYRCLSNVRLKLQPLLSLHVDCTFQIYLELQEVFIKLRNNQNEPKTVVLKLVILNSKLGSGVVATKRILM